MKQTALVLFLLILLCLNINAQDVFINSGKISFEKRINLLRTFQDSNLPQEAIEKMPRYATSSWELYFDKDKSLYKAAKKDPENISHTLLSLSSEKQTNEIYADYSTNQRVLRRNIMDDDYLLTDTIPKIDWKILHELRIIAGYECRKAIGVIYDTVYVVAFYTDEILLRGGPEGFSGLPGTILGLAIPRYNTTWFATKVNGYENHQQNIIASMDGKKIGTEQDLTKLIELFTRYDQDKKEKAKEAKKRLYGFTL